MENDRPMKEPSPGGASPARPDLPLWHKEDLAEKPRRISIRLITSEQEADCQFWVGLSTGGPLSPALLLESPDLSAVFTAAAVDGLNEPGPIMLSDSQVQPPRFIYLLPPPLDAKAAHAKWLSQVLATIEAWSPRAVGFYLAPQLLEPARSFALLQGILLPMISAGHAQCFYLLLGTHGLSSTLNAALKLKAELMTASQIDLTVFH